MITIRKMGKIKLGKDKEALQKKCQSRKLPQNLQMSFVYLQGASWAELFCRTACRHSLYPGTASQCPFPWWAGLWNHSDQTSGTQQKQPLALGGFSHSSTGHHSSGRGSGDFVHENPAWTGACVSPSGWPYFHQDSAGISEDDSANTEKEARTGWRRCWVLNAAACIKLLHLIGKHKPHEFNPHLMVLPHVFSQFTSVKASHLHFTPTFKYFLWKLQVAPLKKEANISFPPIYNTNAEVFSLRHHKIQQPIGKLYKKKINKVSGRQFLGNVMFPSQLIHITNPSLHMLIQRSIFSIIILLTIQWQYKWL